MKILTSFLAFCTFILLLGIVGHFDMVEEIVQNMPEETYYSIRDSLISVGEQPTDSKIVETYMGKTGS